MRIITTIMLIACFTFISVNVTAAADKEVTLTVSSDGASKDEAIKCALRSAIEQTYGTFISSNTSLVNDELIKDEIVTVSTGNIKKYKELFTETLPNGRVFVTLQATVSISKLVSYAKSKGATVEFDGASVAMNIEMEQLNLKSQDKLLDNVKIQLKSFFNNGYDYSIEVLGVDNANEEEGFIISFEVTASPNENFRKAISLLHETLTSLHVPTKQQISTTDYCSLRIIEEFPDNVKSRFYGTTKRTKDYDLRNSSGLEEWLVDIWSFLFLGINNYNIQDKDGVHLVYHTNECLRGEYFRSKYHPLEESARDPSEYLLGGVLNVKPGHSPQFIIYRMEMKEKIKLYVESLSKLKQYSDFKIQSKGE